MKTLLHLLPLLVALTVIASDLPVKISTRWLGDRVAMQKRIAVTVEDLASELNLIRDGLRAVQAASNGEQKAVIAAALQSLEAILQRSDAESVSGLLPLVSLLHTHNTDESPGIIPNIENSAAQSTLNYLIDGISNARMMGAADAVDEQEMEAMLRFYAGNPAQTSEGSWQTNNTMLFVFGERVLDTLVKKAPDRIGAFYKAVQDARKSAQNGSGPDEEAIPDPERPTAEQLRVYEAAFNRLEALAAKGTLPKSDLKKQVSPTQASANPLTVPELKPPPIKAPSSAPAPSPSEESTSSTLWSIIVVLIVAAIGLLWLLFKRRS